MLPNTHQEYLTPTLLSLKALHMVLVYQLQGLGPVVAQQHIKPTYVGQVPLSV
jgi:hypothetical protein